MKSSLMRTFFEWVLITSVLMSVGFFVWFWLTTRAIRATESRIMAEQYDFQNNRNGIAKLMTECQAYARTNAELARFLTPVAPAAPAPATTTKPGVK